MNLPFTSKYQIKEPEIKKNSLTFCRSFIHMSRFIDTAVHGSGREGLMPVNQRSHVGIFIRQFNARVVLPPSAAVVISTPAISAAAAPTLAAGVSGM